MNDKARQQLLFIITKYGPEVCDDPKRCEAFLKDLCPECKREIKVLTDALKANVAEYLSKVSDAFPKELVFAKFSKQLYDDMGIAEEFGRWAVETWAFALGNPGVRHHLRKVPITVSEEDCMKAFGLNKNQRPLEYIRNHYKDNVNGTITDRATALIWQKSGSPDEMPHNQANSHIRELNDSGFAGYADWRLPTIDELKSLLTSEMQPNNLHINPIFDSTRKRCWSSDRHPSGGAWCVFFVFGDILRCDLTDTLHVRAVCSGKG